jgi:tetratricopeptide (TPR) repeat protein
MKGGFRILALSAAFSAVLCGPLLAAQGKSAPKSGPDKVEAILDEIANRLWTQADRHWHQGEYNHIINMHRVTIATRPGTTEAYANSGYLLWSMGRDAEAIALYDEGIKANPKSYSIYDEMGFYYFNRKKDYPRAISYYERAIACDDLQPFTLHMLAHAYERTKQVDKALKTWERAAGFPKNPAVEVAKNHVARLRKKQ